MAQVDVVDAGHRHGGVLGDQPHRLELCAHHAALAREHGHVGGRGDLQHDVAAVAEADAIGDVEPALGHLVSEGVALGREVGHEVGPVGAGYQLPQHLG